MPETVERKQPVIELRNGFTCGMLAIKLADYAEQLAEWQKVNLDASPEQMRSSVEAYRVAIVVELIFAGPNPKVGMWDLSERLGRQNDGVADVRHYQQAWEEIVAFLGD